MTNKVESNVSDQTEKRLSPEVSEQFQQDTRVVAKQAAEFIEEIHPARLLQTKQEIMDLSYAKSDELLDSFAFFRIV